MSIRKALFLALKDMFHPRVIGLVLVIPVFAIIIWFSIFWFLAWQWVQKLSDWLGSAEAFQWVLGVLGVEAVGSIPLVLSILIVILLFLPLTYLTYLFLLSTFGMSYLIHFVGQSHYPELRSIRNPWLGSIANGLFYSIVFLFMFVLTLPLWLLPGMQVFLPILLIAGLNRRIFPYDSSAPFLTPTELKVFLKEQRSSLLVIGLIISILSYTPVLGLFSPTYAALVFSHYCMGNIIQFKAKQQNLN